MDFIKQGDKKLTVELEIKTFLNKLEEDYVVSKRIRNSGDKPSNLNKKNRNNTQREGKDSYRKKNSDNNKINK